MSDALRLLVIEDDGGVAELVKHYLSLLPVACRVDLAADLDMARRRLAVGHYDVIVTDFKLPDGEALDLLQELRGRALPGPSDPETPAVVISGQDGLWELELIKCVVFLSKPFSPEALHQAILKCSRRG